MITVNVSVKGLVLFAAVLVAVSIGGVLVVTQLSAHQDDARGPSVIHACVNNNSGEVKIVGTDGECKNNWTAVHWNTEGAAGGPGPAGPAGPEGPQGAVVIPGPEGPTGPTGSQGSTGPQGSNGAQGPQGTTGPQGPAGPEGHGLPCWDLDDDGLVDQDEDTNDDGNVDVLDCKGPKGDKGDTGPQGPQGDTIVPVQEGWTNIDLSNGPWSPHATEVAPSFFKDSFGIVHFRGLADLGPVNVCAFAGTRPVSYRPFSTVAFNTVKSSSSTGTFTVTVESDGTIRFCGQALWLDGVSYRASTAV